MRQDVAEDRFAGAVISRVVPSRVIERNRVAVDPAHLNVEPVVPLTTQFVVSGGQADDLIARKRDELGLRIESRHDRVDGGEGCLVQSARNAGATVGIDDEAMPVAPSVAMRGSGRPQ